MENESTADCHLSERSGVGRLTRSEFAELARVHPDTVKRWARLGIGPRPHKVGPRLVRYDEREVREYLSIGCKQDRKPAV